MIKKIYKNSWKIAGIEHAVIMVTNGSKAAAGDCYCDVSTAGDNGQYKSRWRH